MPKICNKHVFCIMNLCQYLRDCWLFEKKKTKQVAQGQYVVSDTRCPAVHDCKFEWGEAGQRPRRGRSPVEHRGDLSVRPSVHPAVRDMDPRDKALDYGDPDLCHGELNQGPWTLGSRSLRPGCGSQWLRSGFQRQGFGSQRPVSGSLSQYLRLRGQSLCLWG